MHILRNVLFISLLLSIHVYGQYGVRSGDNILRTGFGAGLAIVDITLSPIIRIEYENLIADQLSVGVNLGAVFFAHDIDRLRGWGITPKVNFHFYSDMVFDFYLGAQVGYATRSSKTVIIYSGQIGANIFINRNFALFVEGGYGMSFITAGLTYRLPAYY